MNLEELIVKSKKGDVVSFMNLLSVKQETFFKIAYTYTNTFHDLEDCVSEASIKAFDKLHQLRNHEKFYAWYTTILINTCRQHYNHTKRQVHQDHFNRLEDIKTIFTLKNVDDRLLLEEILASIKEDEKELLVLKYLKDFSISEIAEIIKVPEGTIKSKIHRTLKYLNKKYRGVKHEW